mgnify:CR=1 FL=1
MKLRLEGEWLRAAKVLAEGAKNFHAATTTVFKKEAEKVKKAVLEGLESQSPAGRKLPPVARATIAARNMLGLGGNKALLASGVLRDGIQVYKAPGGWTVGVTGPHARLAQLLEAGVTRVVRMTEQQRRWFFANIGRSNPNDAQPKSGGGDMIVQKIPARPFFTPVVMEYLRDRKTPGEITKNTALLTGDTFGHAFRQE